MPIGKGTDTMIYDAAIIGTGPAGLSAALNLQIYQKNFIWLGSKNLSDKVQKAEQIRNYPGFFEATGEELAQAFLAHADQMGLEITDQMVNSILPFEEHFALMAGSAFYEAKTLILTTGIAVRQTLKNESELLGKGVSYCAACDGGLYKNKIIAVVCAAKRFEHEVSYLAQLAARVHYFPQYQNVGELPENVVIHTEKPTEITGSQRVDGLILRDGSSLAIDGIFLLRDSISLQTLLPDLALEEGHIAVDRRMATNIPGVFAAGDCTGRPYQYAKAVGEGNVAAHSVVEFLK